MFLSFQQHGAFWNFFTICYLKLYQNRMVSFLPSIHDCKVFTTKINPARRSGFDRTTWFRKKSLFNFSFCLRSAMKSDKQ